MVGLTRPRLVGQPALSVDANLAPLRFPCGARGFFCGRSLVQPTKSRTFDERACWSAFAELATKSVKALSGRLAYPPPLMPLLTQGGATCVVSAGECWRTPRDPPQRSTDCTGRCLGQTPSAGILFDWFRSGRLVGELSVLIKRRHPEVQAEIDRVYQEHLAKLGKRRLAPATQDD